MQECPQGTCTRRSNAVTRTPATSPIRDRDSSCDQKAGEPCTRGEGLKLQWNGSPGPVGRDWGERVAALENVKLCRPSQLVTSRCELFGGGRRWRVSEEAMRKVFRYFVEWRRSALVRRELRLLSDQECSEMGLNDNKVRESFWYLT
jgi:hypothetical protein